MDLDKIIVIAGNSAVVGYKRAYGLEDEEDEKDYIDFLTGETIKDVEPDYDKYNEDGEEEV